MESKKNLVPLKRVKRIGWFFVGNFWRRKEKDRCRVYRAV